MRVRCIDSRVAKLVPLVAHLLSQRFQIEPNEMSNQHSIFDELAELRQSLLRRNAFVNVVRPQLVNHKTLRRHQHTGIHYAIKLPGDANLRSFHRDRADTQEAIASRIQ